MKSRMKTRGTITELSKLGILMTADDGSNGIIMKTDVDAFPDVCAGWSVGDSVEVFVTKDTKHGRRIMKPYFITDTEEILLSPKDVEAAEKARLASLQSAKKRKDNEKKSDAPSVLPEQKDSDPEASRQKDRIDAAFDRAYIKQNCPELLKSNVIPAFVLSVEWAENMMIHLSKSPFFQEPNLKDKYDITYNGKQYRPNRQMSVWFNRLAYSSRYEWILLAKSGSFKYNGRPIQGFIPASEFTEDELRLMIPDRYKTTYREPILFSGIDLMRLYYAVDRESYFNKAFRYYRYEVMYGNKGRDHEEKDNVINFAEVKAAREKEEKRERLMELFYDMLYDQQMELLQLAKYISDRSNRPDEQFMAFYITNGSECRLPPYRCPTRQDRLRLLQTFDMNYNSLSAFIFRDHNLTTHFMVTE